MAQPERIQWKRSLKSAARIVILVYVGFLVLMVGCQRHFIYHPIRESESLLIQNAEVEGYRPWRNMEGTIVGWRPADESEDWRAVVFHGNAGYSLHRTYYAGGFGEDWEVILFEYPGYGARGGRPSESAFFDAAEEAMRLLLDENDRPLLLVGESLGSGIACEMAKRFPDKVAGLLLVTPFTNLADVGKRHFPFLPVRWLLRDRYDNRQALKKYSGPVAVVLAERDEVIPADIGRRLFEEYHGPKKLWVQPGRTHNTLDLSPGAAWWPELTAFLQDSISKTR